MFFVIIWPEGGGRGTVTVVGHYSDLGIFCRNVVTKKRKQTSSEENEFAHQSPFHTSSNCVGPTDRPTSPPLEPCVRIENIKKQNNRMFFSFQIQFKENVCNILVAKTLEFGIEYCIHGKLTRTLLTITPIRLPG